MPTTTTPNMNLVLPNVSQEPGPTWASDLNTAFTLVDSHDHSSGKGVQVTTAGLNINADLTFNSFNALALRSARFTNQSSPLSLPGDVDSVYVSGNNLYYNNNLGQQVQITNGSTLNFGSFPNASTSSFGIVELASVAPQNVAATASAGTGNAIVANADHVHQGVHSVAVQGQSQVYADVTFIPGFGVALQQSGQNITISSSGSVVFAYYNFA